MVLLGDKDDARGAQAGHDWKVQSRQEGGAEAEVSLRGLRLGELRVRRVFCVPIMKGGLALLFVEFFQNDRIRTPALGHASLGRESRNWLGKEADCDQWSPE